MQGPGEYSMSGYGSNLSLITGATKSQPEKPTLEKEAQGGSGEAHSGEQKKEEGFSGEEAN